MVGAPGFDATSTVFDRGAAQIYERVSGNWLEHTLLDPVMQLGSGRFGSSIAIFDDLIAVGAPLAFDASGINTGGVYVYVLQSGIWVLEQRVVASCLSNSDDFYDVSISGNLLVVVAEDHSHAGIDTGAAWVFTRNLSRIIHQFFVQWFQLGF